mgnify:CR=1 FL=1
MYAVIESCGKQYKVAEGDVVFFEKLDVEEGKKVTFDKVILVSNEGKVEVGNPYVKSMKVEGKVVSHGKGKKIIVFKMKAKKNYRRKQGHRQPYTKVEITAIKSTARKTAAKAEKTEKVNRSCGKSGTGRGREKSSGRGCRNRGKPELRKCV